MTKRKMNAAAGVDEQRRTLLKSVGGVTAAATAATIAPAFAARDYLVDEMATPGLTRTAVADDPGQWLDFSFTDREPGHGFFYVVGEATIINRSHHDLVLSGFSPNVIVTDNASYDVSAYLAANPLRIAGGAKRRFYIQARETKHAIVTQTGLGKPVIADGSFSGEAALQARVNLKIESPRIGFGPNRSAVNVDVKLLMA